MRTITKDKVKKQWLYMGGYIITTPVNNNYEKYFSFATFKKDVKYIPKTIGSFHNGKYYCYNSSTSIKKIEISKYYAYILGALLKEFT